MQLNLIFSVKRPLSLPLGHHAALQGFIYSILSHTPEYSEFLHDTGYGDGPHSFKLFVFSTLRGKHIISNGRISYTDKIYLDIRSPKDDFCKILIQSLQNNSDLELFRQPLYLEACSFSNKAVTSGDVTVRMLSPLTLSTTYYEQEKKRTRFIAPVDEDFNDALNKNLADKFEAAFQKKPESLVMLTPVDFSKNHKYVTKFNNHIYINAWNGDYRLSGDPEILTFLYNSGLGSRNSQGFGMFELI